MSNIPEARKMLADLRKAIANGWASPSNVVETIEEVESMMVRKRHKVIQAKDRSAKVTAQIRDDVLLYLRYNPDAATKDVAEMFNINQGRVSEILAGKYDHLKRRNDRAAAQS